MPHSVVQEFYRTLEIHDIQHKSLRSRLVVLRVINSVQALHHGSIVEIVELAVDDANGLLGLFNGLKLSPQSLIKAIIALIPINLIGTSVLRKLLKSSMVDHAL